MKSSPNIFKVDLVNTDKKQIFIDATICSLAEHGYEGTTVRKIAKFAQVAPGLLTHYYEGKEVLIAESYKYLGQRFLDNFHKNIANYESEPIKALQIFFNNFFEPENLGTKYLRVWITFWALTLSHSKLRTVHNDINDQYITSIEAMLNEAYRLAEIAHDGRDSRALASGIVALLDGLWIECCLNPDAFSKDNNLEIVYKFVESATGLKIQPD